jgi:flagellar hook-length control protein FliK
MLNATAPVAQGPLAALAPSGQTQGGSNDGQAFAQALDQAEARQRDASADSAEPSAREGSGAKSEAPDHGRPDATDARPTQGPRGIATRKAGAPETLPDAAIESASTAPGDTATVPQAADDVASPAENSDPHQPSPDLAAWVSSLPLPHPTLTPATKASAASADSVARAAAASKAGADSLAAPPAQVLDVSGKAGRMRDTATADAAMATPPATSRHADARGTRATQLAPVEAAGMGKEAAASAGAMAQVFSMPREPSAARRPGPDVGMELPALPGNWASPLSRPMDQSAPVQAELKAPVGSSEFAPALGSQLSVMVRDGVDHAQLKLNPAEMGPIEVRISLDGTQAQVDFSAAHAATRQALQDAVPALASALRENGLTLTGGGVFEQAREQRGDARQDGSRNAAGTPGPALDSAASTAALPRMPRARGVVDLYA